MVKCDWIILIGYSAGLPIMVAIVLYGVVAFVDRHRK